MSTTSSRRIDSGCAQGASVLVADFKPLSLLATAGVLHQEGFRCVCAANVDAIAMALGMSAGDATGDALGEMDLLVWDVGDDPPGALEFLRTIRQRPTLGNLPAILMAETSWAGLEKKTEALSAPTHCLFKPISPPSLIAIVHHLLWMPSLQWAHRARGGRPTRSGWVGL